MKRRHGGTRRPTPVPNMPFQSPGKPASNNRLGDSPSSRYPHNFFSGSNNDPLDFQRYIIKFLRGMKEINELRLYFAPGGPNAFFAPSRARSAQPMNTGFLDWRTTFAPSRPNAFVAPSRYAAQPMNIGFLDVHTTLGFKGYVCNSCFHIWCSPIFDDDKSIFLKSNHTCDPQKLHEAHLYTDIAGTMYKKRQELISLITDVFDNMITQQELVDLTAVEVPSSVFVNRSDSYEECFDLDTLPSGVPHWAYGAVKKGETVINRTGLPYALNAH
jgi:hypothetical protein